MVYVIESPSVMPRDYVTSNGNAICDMYRYQLAAILQHLIDGLTYIVH